MKYAKFLIPVYLLLAACGSSSEIGVTTAKEIKLGTCIAKRHTTRFSDGTQIYDKIYSVNSVDGCLGTQIGYRIDRNGDGNPEIVKPSDLEITCDISKNIYK